MTPLDMVFALGMAVLAATNLWALRAANEAADERKAIRHDITEQREALAAFRLEAAKSYVAKEHLAVLDERLVRTEERVLAELREFRTTFTAAFTSLGNGRRSQSQSPGGS